MGLIAEAWAQGAAPAGQSSPVFSLVMMLGIFAVFYLMLIRPQQKRAKEQRMMVDALKSGDEVVTNGGILGRITDVTDNFVTLEIADGVQVRVQRHMVGALMPEGTVKTR